METISFTKQSLFQFINSQQYENLENIPISKHRAISQINNPRANDDDVILVAQFDNNRTVGYLGILPDYVYEKEEEIKVGWLTCFWVDDNYKSQNVAASLFLRVIRKWEKRILITNIVPWLDPVYQKTGLFLPTQQKTGFRGYLRFNTAEILPPKKNIFKKITPMLKTIDYALNSLIRIRLSLYKKQSLCNIRYEYLSSFDEINDMFFESHNTNLWNKRRKNELNWIVKNPWILQSGNNDFNSKRYYFSSLDKSFFYQIIKLSNIHNDIVGVALILIRNKNLSVPFIFSDEKGYEVISKIIVNIMLDLKLNMITTFNDKLIENFHKIKTPFIFSKQIKKPYFISKDLNFISNLNFQDGDGDCAFY